MKCLKSSSCGICLLQRPTRSVTVPLPAWLSSVEKRDVLCAISPGPSHDVAQGLLEQQGVYIPLLCLLPPPEGISFVISPAEQRRQVGT